MKNGIPNKKMSIKSFAIKLLLFIFIVFLLDLVVGSMLKHFYFKQESGFYYRTTYAINETRDDLLIFGSSKATHQYHPQLLENELNYSYFNVGRDGSSIFFQYATLKSVLKRYTPKLIILDVAREFENSQDSYDRISMLLPYYHDNPELRDMIMLKSPYEKYKLISKVYPYNSLLFSILVGNLEYNAGRFSDYKGFIPLQNKWKLPLQEIKGAAEYGIDTLKIEAYKSFIQDCKNANIKLVIVSSPIFYTLDKTEVSNKICEEIAIENKVPYFNFTGDSLFLSSPQYFADLGHLNEDGSKIFTQKVIDKVKQIK